MPDQEPFKNDKGSRLSRFIQEGISINPYYFVLLLIGLFGLNFYHVFGYERDLNFSPFFFLIYAIGQSIVEVLSLAFVANLIQKYLHRSIYFLFISLCFLCLFLHYFDFILTQFLDISIFKGVDIILDETLENLIELIHLSGVSLNIWLFSVIMAILIIPIAGAILYYLTSKLAARKPIRVSHGHMLKALLCVPIGLVVLDLTFSPLVDKTDFRFYQRVLPWKATFISKKADVIQIEGALRKSKDEYQALKTLHLSPMSLEKKPNIFLFVAESLREDYMILETAPNVVQFRNENIALKETYSNANCTQLAWYSIFHSNYSLDWGDKRQDWKSGSIPLQTLKKLGYKLHVYSSAQLKYYGVGDLVFGVNNHLLDSYHLYPHYAPVSASDSDEKVIESLLGDLDRKWAKEGNIFVIFLDSTHFNYNWPDSYPMHFTPVSEEKTDLRVSNSIRDIELIKNRYKNSIHYVDSLFGTVINRLKDKGLYDESMIVFTGDHGEEFFEEGQLFHGTHLSRMQTNPPIYYKLGQNERAKKLNQEAILTSHVDIFPTLLDQLVGEQPFFELFDGESIFKDNRFPFVISTRHNAGRSPSEFYIFNGNEKLTVRFDPNGNTEEKTALEIISIKEGDSPVSIDSSEEMQTYLRQVFGNAFQRLFHSK